MTCASSIPRAGRRWLLDEDASSLQLDPRGLRAAAVVGNRVLLREIDTERATELASPGVAVLSLLYSPDGRWLAARALGMGQSVENPVLLWDLDTPAAEARRIEHGDQVRALAFSADGQWLATGTRGQIAQVWRVADGGPACDPMLHPGNVVRDVLFSPDGRRLATACGDQTVRVFDWQEARVVSQVFATGGDVHDWSFSPDGKLLAVLAPDPADATRAFTRVHEVSPPAETELDLVALTEAASALRVSGQGLPVACDPYEGWQRLAEAAPDLWFFRSPARRSISPAFEASSLRWIKDDSVTVGQTRTSMPAVGMVRAAVACWNQRNLVRRRVALAERDPESAEARQEQAELEALEISVQTLAAIAAREAEGDASICLWLSLQAEAASDTPGARRWIDRARALAPEDHEILAQARDVYVAGGDFDAELAALERLVALERQQGLESELVRHRLQLGYNLWRRGEQARARVEFQDILERAEITTLDRVRMLVLLGRTTEALALWSEEMERDPKVGEDLDTFVLLVAGLHREGEEKSALQGFQGLIEISPKFLQPDELRAFGLMPEVEAALLELLAETLARHPELAPE
ncbi:MAG: WD40 repeat domain-containing protein [Planctomycetota bacterium]